VIYELTEVIAVVQARVGSVRLPQKVLRSLNGKPAIYHVMTRTKASKLVDKVYLATSKLDANNVLERLAETNGWNLFRGSEDDVLSRFIEITDIEKPKIVVRVCADNFAIDPDVIDLGILELAKERSDLCSAFISPSFPFGVGAEVGTVDCLKRVEAETRYAPATYREHVFKWAIERPKSFCIKPLLAPNSLRRPDISVSVDTNDDLQNMAKIFSRFVGRETIFRTRDLIKIWDEMGLFTKHSFLPKETG